METVDADAAGVRGVRLSGGQRRTFDHVVLAVPWFRLEELIPAELRSRLSLLMKHLGEFGGSSITAAHLWFDMEITSLSHAVLVGRTSQWLFNHGQRLVPGSRSAHAHYYQVVISASDDLLENGRDAILATVVNELAAIWPDAAGARLVHSRLVTQRQAVFSYRPGLDQFRPAQRTAIPRLHLAGDWTATGWPATMEGAVRSGELAAEAVLAAEL